MENLERVNEKRIPGLISTTTRELPLSDILNLCIVKQIVFLSASS